MAGDIHHRLACKLISEREWGAGQINLLNNQSVYVLLLIVRWNQYASHALGSPMGPVLKGPLVGSFLGSFFTYMTIITIVLISCMIIAGRLYGVRHTYLNRISRYFRHSRLYSWAERGSYLGIFPQSPQCCTIYNGAILSNSKLDLI